MLSSLRKHARIYVHDDLRMREACSNVSSDKYFMDTMIVCDLASMNIYIYGREVHYGVPVCVCVILPTGWHMIV